MPLKFNCPLVAVILSSIVILPLEFETNSEPVFIALVFKLREPLLLTLIVPEVVLPAKLFILVLIAIPVELPSWVALPDTVVKFKTFPVIKLGAIILPVPRADRFKVPVPKLTESKIILLESV